MKPRRRSAACSGRFLLRIESGLHADLRAGAEAMGISLNDYCARKLAAPIGSLAVWAGATRAVLRAAELFGSGLVGVVVFGSWARNEATEGSDVDVLVVVEGGVTLSRALYCRWDEAPVVWDGRPVEPHFVHLPEPTKAVTGLWAEMAQDGIILFTRDLALPQWLRRVRADIASGRIVRRVAHGQPYWVEAA